MRLFLCMDSFPPCLNNFLLLFLFCCSLLLSKLYLCSAHIWPKSVGLVNQSPTHLKHVPLIFYHRTEFCLPHCRNYCGLVVYHVPACTSELEMLQIVRIQVSKKNLIVLCIHIYSLLNHRVGILKNLTQNLSYEF